MCRTRFGVGWGPFSFGGHCLGFLFYSLKQLIRNRCRKEIILLKLQYYPKWWRRDGEVVGERTECSCDNCKSIRFVAMDFLFVLHQLWALILVGILELATSISSFHTLTISPKRVSVYLWWLASCSGPGVPRLCACGRGQHHVTCDISVCFATWQAPNCCR